MKTIAVIGGGITGITTAYALAKRGFNVTLFEKHRYAAMETSFANGGQLSASNAEVWNHWSTIVKGMKWMLKSDAPLLVNPKPSWHKLSWFAEFIASISQYRHNTTETARLAIAAREHLFAWAEEEGIDFDLKKAGILHIYRDQASFNHAGEVSKLLAAGGLPRRGDLAPGDGDQPVVDRPVAGDVEPDGALVERCQPALPALPQAPEELFGGVDHRPSFRWRYSPQRGLSSHPERVKPGRPGIWS